MTIMKFVDKVECCRHCGSYASCANVFNENCVILKSTVSKFCKEREKEEKKKEVKEDKIVYSSEDVNKAMDKMQTRVMEELLSARKECMKEYTPMARVCISMIDALFYLIADGGLENEKN